MESLLERYMVGLLAEDNVDSKQALYNKIRTSMEKMTYKQFIKYISKKQPMSKNVINKPEKLLEYGGLKLLSEHNVNIHKLYNRTKDCLHTFVKSIKDLKFSEISSYEGLKKIAIAYFSPILGEIKDSSYKNFFIYLLIPFILTIITLFALSYMDALFISYLTPIFFSLCIACILKVHIFEFLKNNRYAAKLIEKLKKHIENFRLSPDSENIIVLIIGLNLLVLFILAMLALTKLNFVFNIVTVWTLIMSCASLTYHLLKYIEDHYLDVAKFFKEFIHSTTAQEAKQKAEEKSKNEDPSEPSEDINISII